MIEASVVNPDPTWRPREVAIYLAAHVAHCRGAGIQPMPFNKWLRVSEGKGWYTPTHAEVGLRNPRPEELDPE